MVKLYVFMSACLHHKINADIEILPLQTNADIQEWLKIRVSLYNVCMSAKYIIYMINFFILIYYIPVTLNIPLYTIYIVS